MNSKRSRITYQWLMSLCARYDLHISKTLFGLSFSNSLPELLIDQTHKRIGDLSSFWRVFPPVMFIAPLNSRIISSYSQLQNHNFHAGPQSILHYFRQDHMIPSPPSSFPIHNSLCSAAFPLIILSAVSPDFWRVN